MLIGHIDAFERGKLYGWAFNPDDANEHLLIYVHAGNDILADGIANLRRRDLPDAGIGAGDHAFELRLPAHITSLDNLVVIGQSARHGEIVLPMLSADNQQLNTILQIYSSRYNAALQQIKAELDAVSRGRPRHPPRRRLWRLNVAPGRRLAACQSREPHRRHGSLPGEDG